MHGNVFEFCQDWHSLTQYKAGAARDPVGAVGTMYVIRGGSWSYPSLYSRSSFRSCLEPNGRRDCIGFRVVLEASPHSPGATVPLK
jgi:formylglycine-generating enzyme required for sulfatase activity